MNEPSCACESCASLCRRHPGVFSPGGVRKLAQHLGLTEVELFREHLAFCWWYGDPLHGGGDDTLMVIPAGAECPAGTILPELGWLDFTDPNNACALFTTEGRCSVHAARPTECRWTFHSACQHAALRITPKTFRLRMGAKEQCARAWARPAARRYVAWLEREAATAVGREPLWRIIEAPCSR